MQQVKGNLIDLAFKGDFDLIAHGANCQGLMGSGIAYEIKQRISGATIADHTYKKSMEKIFGYFHPKYMLGTLSEYEITPEEMLYHNSPKFKVLNLYTQVQPGPNFDLFNGLIPALTKVNYIYKGKKIGVPFIGAGIGGGDWSKIKPILLTCLADCDVTIVEFEPKA